MLYNRIDLESQLNLPTTNDGINFPKEFEVVNCGLKVLDRDAINTDDRVGQIRVGDAIDRRGRRLAYSFKQGVDWSKPFPVVFEKDDSHFLAEGFGRDSAFDELNQPSWIYQVIKVKPKHEVSVRLWMNRDIPSSPNSKDDIIKGVREQVSRGFLKKNPTWETSFRKYVKQTNPHIPDLMFKEIINSLVKYYKKSGMISSTPVRFTSYKTKSIMKKWIKTHWSKETNYGFQLTSSGARKLNKTGDYYTGVLPFKYEHIKLINAMKLFKKTGLKTKFIAFAGSSITSMKDLKNKRKRFIESVEEIVSTMESLSNNPYGNDFRNSFEIIGFVPQSKSENVKELIPYK